MPAKRKAVIVHERVSGIRVFLHVVGDAGAFERTLELVSDDSIPAVLRAIAGNDGTSFGKKPVDVGGELPSIL
jgi:hypothetical protein